LTLWRGVFMCACSGAGARTPSYAPSAGLADKLQRLAGSLSSGAGELHRLLEALPQQLAHHKHTAGALHATAFPPGQPTYVPGSSSSSSSSSSAVRGAPPPAAPSVAGSMWGGSQSAAASARGASPTHGSGSSGAAGGPAGQQQQHARALLALPEVCEAEAALDAALKRLYPDANRVVGRHEELRHALRSGRELALERDVMALFFSAPGELAAHVAALRAQAAQLQADDEAAAA
jgi:hypothetical protein